MRRKGKPWLDYTGQTTAQILACKETHRIDSLLAALDQGLFLRESKDGQAEHTEEERVFRSIMALEREVNNGGYHQFFINSSRRYATVIVDALRRTGCEAVAELTARAIGALGAAQPSVDAFHRSALERDAGRDRVLEECDRQFYATREIEPKLFAFVEAHAERIELEPADVPPPPKPRGFTKVSVVKASLEFAKIPELTYDTVHRIASEIAAAKAPEATAAQIDGATYLTLFARSLHAGDLDACREWAPRAFELAWEDTTHCVLHRNWSGKLIEASRTAEADAAALQYLERLAEDDTGSQFIVKRVHFWADLIRKNEPVLPESDRFLRTRLAACLQIKPRIGPG